VRSGEILVARFQRRFVWRDEQRIDLLDSIYKGMPIGSLLTWRTKEHELSTCDSIGPFEVKTNREPAINQYLLDGYQRLTTLYSTLGAGHGAQISKKEQEGDIRWPIYFDLRSETFELKPRNKEAPYCWLDLSIIFETSEFLDFQRDLRRNTDNEELSHKAEEVVELFKDYQIPMVPMATEDLEQVTTSFKRINTKGTTMSEVHMVNALSYEPERNFDLNDRLTEIKQEMGNFGWENFEDRLILQVLKAMLGLDIYRSEASEISQEISDNPSVLNDVTEAIEDAARFMSEKLNVYGPQIIPYSPQPVLIADALHHNDGRISGNAVNEVKRWFWATTYSEHFAGANSSKIRRAQDHLRSVVQGETDDSIPDLSKEVIPIERFDYRWARGRAIALELASLNPQDPSGEPVDGYEQIAEHGNDATPMLFSSKEIGKENNKGPENRFIVRPKNEKEFKERIKKDDKISEDWMDSHALPYDSLSILKDSNMSEKESKISFLECRREKIIKMEKSHVNSIGSKYIS
jgi:hypothetical protein